MPRFTAPEAASRIVDAAVAAFGAMDIFVNNVGRARAGGLMSSSDEDWDEMTVLKLTAMRRLCKAAIANMRRRRGAAS